jgi:Fic family protein
VGMSISEHIKNLRKDKKLKVRQVASITSIDQALISKFENGNRIPTEEHIKALAICYDVPYDSLKKLQLVEMVYTMLHDEPLGYEALIAAEPRLEYIAKKSLSAHLATTIEIQSKLDHLDSLREKFHNLQKQKGIHAQKVDEHFTLKYTYESNKIEGNTLTLSETMMIVKEGITISGKSINEHLEAINHSEAIELLFDFVQNKVHFSESLVLQFHALILRGINRSLAGKYRNVNVRILGAEHIPPEPYLVPKMMEDYFIFYQSAFKKIHPVLLAAQMHERLVTIHPFIDGNGRTARLVMNLILAMHGYPLAILKGDQNSRLAYFKALENVQVNGNPESFYELIIEALTHTLEEHIHLLQPFDHVK